MTPAPPPTATSHSRSSLPAYTASPSIAMTSAIWSAFASFSATIPGMRASSAMRSGGRLITVRDGML